MTDLLGLKPSNQQSDWMDPYAPTVFRYDKVRDSVLLPLWEVLERTKLSIRESDVQALTELDMTDWFGDEGTRLYAMLQSWLCSSVYRHHGCRQYVDEEYEGEVYDVARYHDMREFELWEKAYQRAELLAEIRGERYVSWLEMERMELSWDMPDAQRQQILYQENKRCPISGRRRLEESIGHMGIGETLYEHIDDEDDVRITNRFYQLSHLVGIYR